jgi:hypothetical protein
MPFVVDPQPGEEVYLHKEFRGSHDHVFAMAVSNLALYLPVQKLVLKRDSWSFNRVPLSDAGGPVTQATAAFVDTAVGCHDYFRNRVIRSDDVARLQPDGGRALQSKRLADGDCHRRHDYSVYCPQAQNPTRENAKEQIQMEAATRYR